MIITIESIYKHKDMCEYIPKEEYAYYRGDYLNPHYNSIRCKIDPVIDNEQYCVPKESIWINDVIGFSNNMLRYQKYDCVLEIESFIKVDLNTNHHFSFRGVWRKKVPEKHLPKYSLFHDQSCIEIGNDAIILFSYNNSWISNVISDGEPIEVLARSNLNIKSARLIET